MSQVPNKAVIRELWKRGELTYKLLPEQILFKEGIEKATHPLVVGNISRRFGKSFTLVTYAIEQAIKRRGAHIRYAAAFREDLETYILPAFEQILADCPEDMRPFYMASKKVFKFSNGSTIRLVGLDKNPNSLRGNALSIIIVDEAGFVANLKYIYNSVILPATMFQSNVRIVFISTPPPSPAHFFVNLIQMAKLKGYYLELTIDHISRLTPEQKEEHLNEVGGRDSDTAQREYYCRIISDPIRAVCPTFKEDVHVKEVPEPTYCNWAFSADIGGIKDYAVAYLVAYSHELKKVVFWDEVWFPNRTPSQEIIQGFKKLEGDKKTTRWLDAHGQTQVDFAYAGFSASLPPKDDFQAGLTLIRAAFHNDQIIIHPRCKLLILTLTTGLLNRNGTDYERTDELGHCDALAAAIYGLRVVDKITNYSPNVINQDKWNPYSKKDAPGMSELKKLSWAGHNSDGW